MFKVFGKTYPLRKLILFIWEGLFLFLLLIGTDLLIHNKDVSIFRSAFPWIRYILVVTICLLALYYRDLYTFRAKIDYLDMTTRLLQALGGSSIILGSIFFVIPVLTPERWAFIATIVIFIMTSSLWRYLYLTILKQHWFATPVFLVASGALAETLLDEIRENADCGFRISGIAWPNMPENVIVDSKIPVFDSYDNLYENVIRVGAQKVIGAFDEKRGLLPVKELLRCRMSGIPVVEGETFYENLTGKILVEKINPSWLIFHEGFQKDWATLSGKKVIGGICSFIGLTLLSPLILIVAVLIKIDSSGPIFFRQERVGKDGKTFVLVKFRSMTTDAEKEGAKWATENDQRVTRVGRIIRKLRIDEIPQMWNVLKGEMSFVGPRPERPEFVKELAEKIPYYEQRHTVQPGITGWAQINYPYGASVEDALEKLKYDLYYIKHMCVLLDLYIILKTVKTILFREGSR